MPAATKSRLVALSLPPALLDRFPRTAAAAPKPTKGRSSSSKAQQQQQQQQQQEQQQQQQHQPPSPSPTTAAAAVAPPATADGSGDGDDGSTPAATDQSSAPRRKGVPGPKPGAKRTSGAADAALKPRGKPGPKKKPRLDDGSAPADGSPARPNGNGAAAAPHKLGPKANTGAINAGLRALDRTGTPCRKWQRTGFKLKSFTGVVWELPSWAAPPRSDSRAGSANSSPSDDAGAAAAACAAAPAASKQPATSDSADKSNSGDADSTRLSVDESPAPAIAAS